MAFRIAQQTLERLEWPQALARLRDHCRTPSARKRLDWDDPVEPDLPHPKLFEDTHAAVCERLAETSEARKLLDAGEIPPLGGVCDLEPSLRRAGKGASISGSELLDIRSALSTLRTTASFALSRVESCPRLAALAGTLGEHRDLEKEIEWSIDDAGEVRNEASTALRDARKDAARLASDLQQRLARYLQNPNITSHLSDTYYTVRNDRYVLPVRSDSKGRVRGIVHDASASGATLFIEPEGVVELNNRLKQTELAVAREVQRVLRDLSSQVAVSASAIGVDLETLGLIDLGFARGRLSQEMEAVEPIVGRDGIFELPQLRHPLLQPDESVPNDLRLGDTFSVLVLSGPNAGGKTVAMKAVALAALFMRAGLHVAAGPGARVDLVTEILADIGDDQDIRESLSTFSAHMANLARIVDRAEEHTLVVLDEVGVGTDPGEGAALAQAVLETLAESGARVVTTTHYNLLKEMAAVDERFCNASVEFDPETLAPTYRLHLGAPGVSSATAVAARMGMPGTVLDRANTLLQREDRRLDRMLSELSASRSTLEREQHEVSALRAESESVRDQYREKLERLQERRDKLFHEMRNDLDRSFKDAHAHVAAVIRDLQRTGTAQSAAHARSQLLSLEEKTRAAEDKVKPNASEEERFDAVDWRRVKPGDTVRVPGGGEAVLEALPDRSGKVRVRAGSARMVLAAERVGAIGGKSRKDSKREKPVEKAPERVTREGSTESVGGGTLRCDLRGQRVDEAIDRVIEALDEALSTGRDAIVFVHGHGTGALKKAVREHLTRSPHISKFRAGDREEGGDGVTYAFPRS